MRRGCFTLMLTACVSAPLSTSVVTTVLCPAGEQVMIAGALRGVGRGVSEVEPGSLTLRCGERPRLEVQVRPGVNSEEFDFRGLSAAAAEEVCDVVDVCGKGGYEREALIRLVEA